MPTAPRSTAHPRNLGAILSKPRIEDPHAGTARGPVAPAPLPLSARTLAGAERVRDEIRGRGHERVHAFACDLTDPSSIREFATGVARHTDRVDVLINNGSRYLSGPDLLSASDADVVDTLASGGIGTVLTVKNFLPLLLNSPKPDIVTMISACGTPGHHRSDAHDAFYAAKTAQTGFTEILSKRLRPQGVRVISLYPPDFTNPDPLSEDQIAQNSPSRLNPS